MNVFEDIKQLIQSHLNDAHIEVFDLTGTSDHLGINVYSDQFQDMSLIEQHQRLMDILSPRLASDIHAVKLKTMTLAKARAKGVIDESKE